MNATRLRYGWGLLGILLISSFVSADRYRPARIDAFRPGETLEFRVHYGFITAGEAVIRVEPQVHTVNRRPCYKIEVSGRSTGAFDMFTRIRDAWGTYVDTLAYVPQRAYRNIEEGKYRKYEVTEFDHARDTAVVVDARRQQEKRVAIPEGVFDLVSGSYYLRLLPYERMRVGDTIRLDGLLENQLYHLKVVYQGRQMLKTSDFGKVEAHCLVPQMPNNKLFDGENAIEVFVSADRNRIPLKIRANMFVGAVEVDLRKHSGLRYPFGG